MRINESQFLSAAVRAENMGLSPDESEKFLADLTNEAGEKVKTEVVRPLLRIFAGKEVKEGDRTKLLSVVKSLHEYGESFATEDIENGDLQEWTENQKSSIKLLVATLEGWLFGEHPINIKARDFPLVIFLVNRLAKISENQTKDREGKLLVPNLGSETLSTFAGHVDNFAQEALKPETIDEQMAIIQGQIDEIHSQRAIMEAEIKEIEKEDDRINGENIQRTKQMKKVKSLNDDIFQYSEAHKRELERELSIIFDVLVEKLRDYRERFPNPKWSVSVKAKTTSSDKISYETFNILIDFILKNKSRLIRRMLNGDSLHIGDEIEGCIYDNTGDIDYVDYEQRDYLTATLKMVMEDVKKNIIPTKKEPVRVEVQKPKITLRSNDFGSLATLKDVLPEAPNPNDFSLRDLLVEKLKSVGPVFDVLLRKKQEAEGEYKKLSDMTVTHDYKKMREKAEELSYKLYPLFGKMREVKNLKTASLEPYNISKGESLRDLNRPGAGLYLLKSILIAIKMAADKGNAKTADQVNAFSLVEMAVDPKMVNRGSARVFDVGSGDYRSVDDQMGKSDRYTKSRASYQDVHYLPQHMPFARMAAAMILKSNHDKKESF